MSEVKCIIGSALVSEKNQLKEDLFKGISLNILISLLDGEKTANNISEGLNIPIFSTMLYISRLLKGGLIVEAKCKSANGTIEKVYKLSSSDLEIVNWHKGNLNDKDSKKLECEAMASHFSKLTTKSIKNIYKYSEKPYAIKSCFIKGNEQRMKEFQKKLNDLFTEFNGMEEEDAEGTYGFIATFTPYDLDTF